MRHMVLTSVSRPGLVENGADDKEYELVASSMPAKIPKY